MDSGHTLTGDSGRLITGRERSRRPRARPAAPPPRREKKEGRARLEATTAAGPEENEREKPLKKKRRLRQGNRKEGARGWETEKATRGEGQRARTERISERGKAVESTHNIENETRREKTDSEPKPKERGQEQPKKKKEGQKAGQGSAGGGRAVGGRKTGGAAGGGAASAWVARGVRVVCSVSSSFCFLNVVSLFSFLLFLLLYVFFYFCLCFIGL